MKKISLLFLLILNGDLLYANPGRMIANKSTLYLSKESKRAMETGDSEKLAIIATIFTIVIVVGLIWSYFKD